MLSEYKDGPTVTRDDRGAHLHYGEGIGGNIYRSRPGFRFTGYADTIADRAVNHRGWYGDDEGFTIHRGVVYQIPARDGIPQYLSGSEWGDSGARGTFDSGGGSIDLTATYDCPVDAAIAADRIAELAAEAERGERRAEAEAEAEVNN